MGEKTLKRSEILVEKQSPQGVFVCDHAGRVSNKFSVRFLTRFALTNLVSPGSSCSRVRGLGLST